MSSFGRRRLMPLLLVVCGFLALPGTALGATILDAETGLPASGAEIPVEATFSWQTAFGGFDECSVDSVLVVDESAEQASLPGGFTQEAACTQGTGQFTGCTIDSTETPEGWTDFDSFGLGEGFLMRMHFNPGCWGGVFASGVEIKCNPLEMERESEETPLDSVPLANTNCGFWMATPWSVTIGGSLHFTEGEWVIAN